MGATEKEQEKEMAVNVRFGGNLYLCSKIRGLVSEAQAGRQGRLSREDRQMKTEECS